MANMRTSLLGAGRVISQPKAEETPAPESPETPAPAPDSESPEGTPAEGTPAEGTSAESDSTSPQATPPETPDHTQAREMANALRFLSVDAVEQAGSGHPGLPLGAADIITTLWTKFISYDPHHPDWIDRDRFVLSAGHGSALLYALLYLIGTNSVNIDDIKNFRQLDSRTPGHPERHCMPGVEVSTGPLGQGVAMAVGMAIAERKLNHTYSDDIFEHFTYALASDGDLMEGVSAESCALAGHLKLGRLIVLYDSNKISIDGDTALSDSTDTAQRFQSMDWHVQEIDGHNPDEIEAALLEAQTSLQPSLIICKTTIGFGAPTKSGTAASHGAALGTEELAATRKALQWDNAPFEIPSNILDDWRIAGLTMAKKHGDWTKRWDKLDNSTSEEITRRFALELPDGLGRALNSCKRALVKGGTIATRKASTETIKVLTKNLPELIGGSADLSESNGTKIAAHKPFTHANYGGNYIHYGVREHAMAAAMNGMSAHGGVQPFGGTFLIFSDYCKPALRLAALMEIPTLFVFTHDSIGVGEDGPTHQPIEQLPALRAIPNLNVFRPADGVEVVECWQLALQEKTTPSALVLSRQDLPIVRGGVAEENRSRRGAYEIRGVDGNEDLTILASGSEVSLALDVARRLYNRRVVARVVSVPCMELFARQSAEHRAQVLGISPLRIIIEAAGNSNWHDIVGDGCHFIGMNSFGASAPAKDLFKKFGFTQEAITEKITDLHTQYKQKEKREDF